MVGGHWGILQSVAWVKMTWDLSTDQTVTEAIDQVLRGENPCRLCQAVALGKKAEQDLPILKQKLKLDFEWRHSALTVFPPSVCASSPCLRPVRELIASSPPLPPPRFV